LTVPFPVPDVPPVIEIQLLAVEAVQAQPTLLVTATLPVPPDARTDAPDGLIKYEHSGEPTAQNPFEIKKSAPVICPPAAD
jgi:hypothetical protein